MSLNFAFKLGRAIVAERIITLITRFVDLIMVYLMWYHGPLVSFIITTPIYILTCMAIVAGHDLIVAWRKDDFLGLDYLNGLPYQKELGKFEALLAWIMRKRFTIFWIGSWFYLDPDVVTLLLRDKRTSFWKNTMRITVPSVLLSMVVWTSTYWFGIKILGWTWEQLVD